jgi:hypothetical protein
MRHQSIWYKLASNIVLAYAAKLQAVFETLGKRNPSIHNETLNHWIKVYQEFESSGFAMPPRLDYVFCAMLLDKATLGKFRRLSPEKRTDFLKEFFGEKAPNDPDAP